MTTVAFDGTFMAADSLALDAWGLKEVSVKIHERPNMLIGGAGESGAIHKWLRGLPNGTVEDVLSYGYPTYDKDKDDPSLILFDRESRKLYRHVAGIFLPCSRTFHAVGSGRDFALAAMACGKTATQAVEIAMAFDNGTGGEIHTVRA